MHWIAPTEKDAASARLKSVCGMRTTKSASRSTLIFSADHHADFL
jgi:hypothetical protein